MVNQVAKKEPRRPAYIARAKVNGGWITIGGAWALRSRDEGFSVQLNSIPVAGWSGQFVLLPPLVTAEVENEGGA